jgi:hypothetical protein
LTDEAATLDRQVAYLERVRALGRPQRFAGFVACALGVAMMVLAKYRLDGAPWLLWPGVAVIALGWILFVYALARRLVWVRAHPFDPDAPDSNVGDPNIAET